MSTSVASVGSAFEELSGIQRAAFSVGNSGDETTEVQVNGHIYIWAPHGEKGSILPVTDHLNYHYIDSQKKGERNLRSTPDLVEMQAYDVVLRMFSNDQGFQGDAKGLYLVKHDGKDEIRRQVARAKYVQYRVERAERRQARWAEMIENIKPGEPRPTANPELRADLEFLAKYRSGALDRKAFWSFYQDFESDSRDAVIAHLRTAWPDQFAAKGETLVVSRDQAAPRAQNDPKSQSAMADLGPAPRQIAVQQSPAVTFTAADAKYLFDLAGKLGYSFTETDLAAILAKNEPAIEAIVEKLGKLEAAQDKEPVAGE
jgi:hypothetical protein